MHSIIYHFLIGSYDMQEIKKLDSNQLQIITHITHFGYCTIFVHIKSPLCSSASAVPSVAAAFFTHFCAINSLGLIMTFWWYGGDGTIQVLVQCGFAYCETCAIFFSNRTMHVKICIVRIYYKDLHSAVLKFILDTFPHYSRTYCSSSSAKQRWWSIGHLLFFMGDKKAFLEFPWRIIHLFPFSCLASTVQRTTK